VPAITASIVFVLALIGFGTKAGMMPLHTWLPEAHPAAPAHISALMSGVMIKTALLLLVRFIFEFLPSPSWWWGPAIMLIGAVSAVLGILQGSAQTDLKRLLAFSSIENIGLMTLSLGAAVVFLGYHVEALVAIALIALLFHIVNHAMFKGLLFLSAGTVVAGAGTANMEKLGGVIRFLPRTAVAFFLAALAVSAFPPLNGFASEWLIFQTMLVGLSAPYFLIKAVFLIALTALAFASGITILAFAKAFGMTFLARTRMTDMTHMKEASGMMQLSYLFLGTMIVVLGLMSKKAIEYFEHVALSVGNENTPASALRGLNVPIIDLIPTAIIFVAVLVLVFLIVRIFTRENTETIGDTWDCGYPLYPNNEISATAFSRTILMFLKRIIPTRKHVDYALVHPDSPYFFRSKTVVLEVVDVFGRYLYQPIGKAIEWFGAKIKHIQNGNLNAYILYVLIVLILLVAIYI
jgi:hydrogenase-4 component B